LGLDTMAWRGCRALARLPSLPVECQKANTMPNQTTNGRYNTIKGKGSYQTTNDGYRLGLDTLRGQKPSYLVKKYGKTGRDDLTASQTSIIIIDMRILKNPPDRMWFCPYRDCDYCTARRWLLKSHLMQYHKVPPSEAQEIAEDSEYWLRTNPRRRYYVEEDEYDYE